MKNNVQLPKIDFIKISMDYKIIIVITMLFEEFIVVIYLHSLVIKNQQN